MATTLNGGRQQGIRLAAQSHHPHPPHRPQWPHRPQK